MNNDIAKDGFIRDVAKHARFTEGDTRIIIDSIVSVLEGYARYGYTAKIRGFGKLYHSIIPKRKGKDGQELPETTRTIFKLSENIRNANKE